MMNVQNISLRPDAALPRSKYAPEQPGRAVFVREAAT